MLFERPAPLERIFAVAPKERRSPGRLHPSPSPQQPVAFRCRAGCGWVFQGCGWQSRLRWREQVLCLALPVGSLDLPVVTLLPHVGQLLTQERNQDISGGVALLRWLLRAGRKEGREGSVKFGGIDLPSAVLIAGGADLPRFDVPEHGAFVDAGSCGGGCEIIHG
jgi:hypothetical protein